MAGCVVSNVGLKDVIKNIMEMDVPELVFLRSFTQHPSSVLIMRRYNELVASNPDLQDIVTAFAVYPALKWAQKAEDIDAVMARVCSSDANAQRLINVQKALSDVTGYEPKLMLNNRKRYFEASRKLTWRLEHLVEQIRDFPGEGEIYANILGIMLGDTTADVSKYMTNQYAKAAMELAYDCAGKEIDGLVDDVLTGIVQSDDEMSLIYHNIDILLREYNRILWHTQNSDDRAMRLLACESEEEMLKITEHDEKYRQAYLIVEYIKLINGAIEMVKTFPVNGQEYYDIIRTVIELKPKRISDEAAAERVGMSTYSFSVKKRRALSVLSTILWGCDGDTFVRFLTDKA